MSKGNANIAFWESVERTDPNMTKNVTVSGQQRTTVDAQHKKKIITCAFGMYGMGWGVLSDSELFERQSYQNETVILHYRAIAFYIVDCKQYTFPIAASIKESYVTKNGNGYLKIDDEAVKKVRTDALTKGFTDLGFCADIHMGKFDDDNYIISQMARVEIENEENSQEAIDKAREDISEWVKKEIESASKLLPKRETGYRAVMKGIREKLIIRCQAASIHPTSFTKRFDEVALNALAEAEELNKGQDNAS